MHNVLFTPCCYCVAHSALRFSWRLCARVIQKFKFVAPRVSNAIISALIRIDSTLLPTPQVLKNLRTDLYHEAVVQTNIPVVVVVVD